MDRVLQCKGLMLHSQTNPISQLDYLEPDLWCDEESTDNPTSISTLPLPLLDSFCSTFDPIKQLHQFQQMPKLLDSSYEGLTLKLRDSINIATVELTDHPSHTDIQVYSSSTDSLPIVIDTGASVTLSPNPDDFIGPIKPCSATRVNGLSSSTIVAGVGTVRWTIRDVMGTVRSIKTEAYYVPAASIRLFSPQKYFKEQGSGSLLADKDGATLTLQEGTRLVFPYQLGSTLPLMLTEQHFNHASTVIGLTFSDVEVMLSIDDGVGLLNVAHTSNQNLTAVQQELKSLHDKLAHCDMQRIQELSVDRTQHGERRILVPKHKGVSSCTRPLCAACSMGKQTVTSSRAHRQLPTRTAGGIRAGDLTPGAGVSIDQYQSSVRGRLPHTQGKEPPDKKYTGGSIYYDHSSQDIFVQHQISLRDGETLQAKYKYEGYCKLRGIRVKHYHADNSPFGNNAYRSDCTRQQQSLSFSGVGAHHQNAVAERAIRTITNWSRTMILHSLLYWPEASNLDLWPYAMDHAVYVWNNLPQRGTHLAPTELHTRSRFSHYDHLSSLAVWGCPVYVLEPKLQDGKKLPKWKPRTRRGMYLGKSDAHANTVGRILNLKTGYISPQYHCVYDNLFTTVARTGDEVTSFDPLTWDQLIQSGYERSYEPEYDIHGRPLPGPMLQNEWLSGVELKARNDLKEKRWRRLRKFRDLPESDRDPRDIHVPEGESEGVVDSQLPSQFVPVDSSRAEDNVETSMDDMDGSIDPSVREAIQRAGEELDDAIRDLETPLRFTRSGRRVKSPSRLISTMFSKFKPYHEESQNQLYQDINRQRVRHITLDDQFIHTLDWSSLNEDPSDIKDERLFGLVLLMNQTMDPDGYTFEQWDPLILTTVANAQDTPNWSQAMNGPNKQGFWKACKIEVTTLETKGSWEVVEREVWMNVIQSTWAFKIKRFPHGAIRKLKARFCARGDMQIEGIDFFETFAPVVSWSTVRIMLILSIVLGLKTRQVDYTAAFVHALIDRDPNWDNMTTQERDQSGIFIEMPRGFREPGKVLKLKRSLYGLKQSPRNFFLHLKDKLEACGFVQQQDVDACLFISEKVICLVYVDDTLFFANNDSDIDDVIAFLRGQELELSEEDDVAGFLGVHINREKDGKIILTQTGLTERIIKALNLGDEPSKDTPAIYGSLSKDVGGELMNGTFSYASVIGMLLYLSGHSRPDISFAVSQCARFSQNPTRLHEEALRRIGLYLKKTRTNGLILQPNLENGIKLDCYADADFAGLWGFEDRNDPTCVKSRTGYIIFMSECPILWVSRLQTEIATSTMEAEYIALSTAMRELLPIKHKIETITKAFDLGDMPVTEICKTVVHEDNMGCLKLSQLEPGRMTPRSKHYGIKYHWFRSKIKPEQIVIKHIGSDLQRADFLTKSLRTVLFQENRKLSMGW